MTKQFHSDDGRSSSAINMKRSQTKSNTFYWKYFHHYKGQVEPGRRMKGSLSAGVLQKGALGTLLYTNMYPAFVVIILKGTPDIQKCTREKYIYISIYILYCCVLTWLIFTYWIKFCSVYNLVNGLVALHAIKLWIWKSESEKIVKIKKNRFKCDLEGRQPFHILKLAKYDFGAKKCPFVLWGYMSVYKSVTGVHSCIYLSIYLSLLSNPSRGHRQMHVPFQPQFSSFRFR